MFNVIYFFVLNEENSETITTTLRGVYLDELQPHSPFLTVAGTLASSGLDYKVALLRDLGASVSSIAQGYALAGNHAKVEEYRRQYNAYVSAIAQGYALAGNHTKVEEYRTQHNAPVNSIAQGYAQAGNHTKVEEYRTQHNAPVNFIAVGYAQAGNHAKVEEYRTQHNVPVNSIAVGYAQAGNHAKVEEYLTQHNASVNLIAKGYAQAGNHAKVEEYRTQHNVPVNSIAQGYVQAGNHAKVEEYRRQYNVPVNSIVECYALVGNHAKVEEYRRQHNVSVYFIARSYAQAGNHAKVEEYRTQYNAPITSIIEGYALAGNPAKVVEYGLLQPKQNLFLPHAMVSPLFNQQQQFGLHKQHQFDQHQNQNMAKPQTNSPTLQPNKRTNSDFLKEDTMIPANKKPNNSTRDISPSNTINYPRLKPGALEQNAFFSNESIQTNVTSGLSNQTNSVIYSSAPVSQEILPVKKEPVDNHVHVEKRPASITEFNHNDMLKVVRILRDNNNATRNCTHLAKDVMHYLLTGEIPDMPSHEADSTLEDFSFTPNREKQLVKKENGKTSSHSLVTQATTYVGPFFQQHPIPPRMEPYTHNNTIHVDGPLVANLDHYSNEEFPEPKVNIRSLESTLQSKALQNGGVSFGYLHLERVKEKATGHMLVYFSTEKETWYIDGQKLNGKTKQGEPVYNDIKNKYHFYGVNYNRIDDNSFQSDVFLIPMSPYTIPQEYHTQAFNRRSY